MAPPSTAVTPERSKSIREEGAGARRARSFVVSSQSDAACANSSRPPTRTTRAGSAALLTSTENPGSFIDATFKSKAEANVLFGLSSTKPPHAADTGTRVSRSVDATKSPAGPFVKARSRIRDLGSSRPSSIDWTQRVNWRIENGLSRNLFAPTTPLHASVLACRKDNLRAGVTGGSPSPKQVNARGSGRPRNHGSR